MISLHELHFRSVAKPSPFSRMRRKTYLVQDTHYGPGRLQLRNSGRTCDQPSLGTHRCLELAYSKSFWRALPFRGGKFCGTYRPLHPAPLSCPSAHTQIPHFTSLVGYILELSPPSSLREQASRVACPGCLASRTHQRNRETQLAIRRERTACDELRVTAEDDGCTGRTIVAIRNGNGMSRTSS